MVYVPWWHWHSVWGSYLLHPRWMSSAHPNRPLMAEAEQGLDFTEGARPRLFSTSDVFSLLCCLEGQIN